MDAPVACTIASNNYLAYARVFTDSFLDQHPRGRVFVLVADRPHETVDYAAERFTTVFAEQLGVPAFPSFAFRYSILELNTAVKPYFLEHLIRREGVERLCYFDPDILVLDDLGDLYRRFDAADLLLTPHITEPLADGGRPSERDLLQAGVYNLGFVGLRASPDTARLLDWWQERLFENCLHRVEEGLFVDQRWMDLAPALVAEVEVVREPGYNVAYWNLEHRRLERRDGRWRLDGGAPLYFFHFSGFEPDDPDSLSRYQDRYRLADRPAERPLFLDYGDRLERAGHPVTRRLDYGFGRFGDGTAVPPAARETLRRLDPRGERWPDPFAAAGEDSFRAWLEAPVELGDGVRVPRLAHCLWEQRDDLQRAFPDLGGADGERFARWLRTNQSAAAALGVASAAPGRPHALPGSARHETSPEEELAERPGPWETPLTRRRIAWLTADAGHDPEARPRVPRLALRLHASRADLQRAFPEPLGTSRPALALWYVTYGRREHLLPRPLVAPVLRSLSWGRRLHALLWWLLKGRQRT